MYLYEQVLREHELRVARSLERYNRRMNRRPVDSDGLVLFTRARRSLRRG